MMTTSFPVTAAIARTVVIALTGLDHHITHHRIILPQVRLVRQAPRQNRQLVVLLHRACIPTHLVIHHCLLVAEP